MSKFFGIEKRDKKNANVDNQEPVIQGYIAPSNRFIRSENAPDQPAMNSPETFVYQSVHKNNTMEQSYPANQNVLSPYGVSGPNENVMQTEVLDMPDTVSVPEVKEEILDPLNNGSNPVPVNPVAAVEEVFVEEDLPTNAKANVFSVIGMIFGMIFTPGTTIIQNSKKYRSFGKAVSVTIWITIVTLLLCLAARVLTGSFYKTYSAVTGAYTLNFDLANLFRLENYLEYVVLAFIVSFVAIFVVSLIYYASSFVNSKGVPFGSYLMVSNLALLPFIIGTVVLYPVANLVSSYLGLLVCIFSFLYTLVSFLIGIGEILTFKNINRKILYNVLNLTFVILILILVIVLCIRLNILILPEISV